MKKKILLTIGLSFLMFGAVGCGSKSGWDQNPSELGEIKEDDVTESTQSTANFAMDGFFDWPEINKKDTLNWDELYAFYGRKNVRGFRISNDNIKTTTSTTSNMYRIGIKDTTEYVIANCTVEDRVAKITLSVSISEKFGDTKEQFISDAIALAYISNPQKTKAEFDAYALEIVQFAYGDDASKYFVTDSTNIQLKQNGDNLTAEISIRF